MVFFMKKLITMMLLGFSMVLSAGVFATSAPPKDNVVLIFDEPTAVVVAPIIAETFMIENNYVSPLACTVIETVVFDNVGYTETLAFAINPLRNSDEFLFKKYHLPLKIGLAHNGFSYLDKNPRSPKLKPGYTIDNRFRYHPQAGVNRIRTQINKYHWATSKC
jgi:hypothetical protein